MIVAIVVVVTVMGANVVGGVDVIYVAVVVVVVVLEVNGDVVAGRGLYFVIVFADARC